MKIVRIDSSGNSYLAWPTMHVNRTSVTMSFELELKKVSFELLQILTCNKPAKRMVKLCAEKQTLVLRIY